MPFNEAPSALIIATDPKAGPEAVIALPGVGTALVALAGTITADEATTLDVAFENVSELDGTPFPDGEFDQGAGTENTTYLNGLVRLGAGARITISGAFTELTVAGYVLPGKVISA